MRLISLLKLEISNLRRVEISSFRRVEISKQTNRKADDSNLNTSKFKKPKKTQIFMNKPYVTK